MEQLTADAKVALLEAELAAERARVAELTAERDHLREVDPDHWTTSGPR